MNAFCQHSERRMAAGIMDLFLQGLGLVLLLLLARLSGWQIQPQAPGLNLGVPILAWLLSASALSGWETMKGQSPGRAAFGLKLQLQKSEAPGFARLWLRQLLKTMLFWPLLVVASLLLSQGLASLLQAQQTTVSTGLWAGSLLGGLVLLSLMLCLSLGGRQGRNLLDRLSGTHVKLESDSPQRAWKWQVWAVLYLLGLGSLTHMMLSALSPCCSDAHNRTVRQNLNQVQNMLETYAVDWSGRYPPSAQALYQAAQESPFPYWKTLKNPYPQHTPDKLWTLSLFAPPAEDLDGALLEARDLPRAGAVHYLPAADGLGYWLYGYDQDLQLLPQILSNDF